MRRLVAAGLLLAGSSLSAQDPFLTGEALSEEIKKREDGCMVFTKQEMADLVQRVNLMIQEREAVAFKRGALSCRNAI